MPKSNLYLYRQSRLVVEAFHRDALMSDSLARASSYMGTWKVYLPCFLAKEMAVEHQAADKDGYLGCVRLV